MNAGVRALAHYEVLKYFSTRFASTLVVLSKPHDAAGQARCVEPSLDVSQVGGFCLMYKEDMKRVAPLWLKYSRAVRHDPDVSPLPVTLPGGIATAQQHGKDPNPVN